MEQEMTNHEHIIKFLVGEVTQKERHQNLDPHDEVIKLRKAVIWLADRVDELEAKTSPYTTSLSRLVSA